MKTKTPEWAKNIKEDPFNPDAQKVIDAIHSYVVNEHKVGMEEMLTITSGLVKALIDKYGNITTYMILEVSLLAMHNALYQFAEQKKKEINDEVAIQ